MATISSRSRNKKASASRRATNGQKIPLLHNGDKLTQQEFHRRYEAYPEDVKFELIGGTVYMASPLGELHGTYHPELSGAYWLYKAATPGVALLDNATTVLGEESEPQPDLALRILPDWGGHSHSSRGYIKGPPELLTEIAHSSKALDLHAKKADYQKAGVLEYAVWSIEERKLYWFTFDPAGDIAPDSKGIYRSVVFPGLWVDSQALVQCDSSRLIEVVQQGLASPEHAAFVKKLEAARRKKK